MIDADRTLSVLGVDVSTLTPGSHKMVFRVCEGCGHYHLVEFRNAKHTLLCLSCGHSGEKNHKWIKPPEKKQLETLYIIEKKSAYQIGDIFGCSNTRVLRWLRDYDIPIRTMSEIRSGKKLSQAHKDAIKRSSPHLSGAAHPLYGRCGEDAVWFGRHHTEETKTRLRDVRLDQKMPTKDTKIEIRFNTMLDKHGYEIITQEKCCGVCIPDFLFPDRRIAVFCDGDYWHNLPGRQEKDQYINEILLKNGWIPVRFWEHEINNNIDDCFYRFELNYWGGEC